MVLLRICAALAALAIPALASASIVVTGYTLVSSTRVDRTVFDYTYRVTFKNDGSATASLDASVTSKATTTEVISGSIPLGVIAAGAAVTPSGTITLRQDRTVQFSIQNLVWAFSEESTGAITPSQRTASINAVKAYRASLEQLDLVQGNEMLASFMRTRPEFSDAGTSDHGLNVWGTWRDGVIYMLVRNREGKSGAANALDPKPSATPLAALHAVMPRAAAASGASSPEDGKSALFPASKQFRLLHAMGGAWHDSRDKIRAYFKPQLYEELASDASIAGLRTVGGEGVLYFNTHAGDRAGLFALASSSVRNEYLEKPTAGNTTWDDLTANRVVIMSACFDPEGADFNCNMLFHPSFYSEHYAITSLFIEKYWKKKPFADNSLIFLDACNSNNASAAGLTTALLDNNASRIVGWSASTDDDLDGTGAEFVFDRLLGANDIPPRAPGKVVGKQRPFDILSTLAACIQEQVCGSLTDPTRPVISWTQLHPTCNTCDFGILAPSVRQLFIVSQPPGQPEDTLQLAGFFGEDVGSGGFDAHRTVKVGGIDLPILQWSPTVILAGLPQSGGGSTGDVLVQTNDRTSNTARLTEWKVPFKITLADLQSLKAIETVNAHFRADIRTPVEIVDQGPHQPEPLFPHESPLAIDSNRLMVDSSANYTCTGSATVGSNATADLRTFKLSDAGTLSYKDASFASPVEVHSSTELGLGLANIAGYCKGSVTTAAGTFAFPMLLPYETEVSPADLINLTLSGAAPFVLRLDQDGKIGVGGISRTTFSRITAQPVSISAAWVGTAPEPGTAPDPDAAR
jgi:hypothetical protein